MLCGNKYTDEEIKRGIGVLKAIKKRPNMSLREFKTSFINKKLVVKMVVFAIGKLRWISVQCFKHPSPHEKYRSKLFKGDVAMVMLLDSLRGQVPAGPKYYTLAGPVVYVEKLNILMIQCKEHVVKL